MAIAHLRGWSSMPIVPRYAATASTLSAKSCRVWTTTSKSSMQAWMRPLSSPLAAEALSLGP